jgi:hypothetical protein
MVHDNSRMAMTGIRTMAAGDDMRVTGASTLADSKANALPRAVTLADLAIRVALRIRAAATVVSAGRAPDGPLHKLRQVGSGSGLSLREDGRGVLPHRFVYLTEDDDASRLHRFLPRAWGDLFCPAGSRRRQ